MAASPEILVQKLRRTFESGKCRPLSFRKNQLKSLLSFLDVEEKPLLEAVRTDLGKCRVETILLEIDVVRNALRTMLYDLDDWAKDEHVGRSVVTLLDSVFIRPEPLGVVLVISPWNYPVQLSLLPVAGAIAAGNCVLFKPSELAPQVSAFFKATLGEYLERDCLVVHEGGPKECSDLLKLRFDHIFFTGGGNVGKIVAKAAAEHLTPCTLELGGKSPVYIDSTVDMMMAAKRLVWGKCVNMGQTCVAPDYILCSRKTEELLLPCLKQVFSDFFGSDPLKSTDLARIINDRHFDRLRRMMQGTKAHLEMGGVLDNKERFIDLHVYTNVDADDAIMQEEIFGPILPIVRADDADDAIRFINFRDKPLSLYIFSKDKEVINAISTKTSSGSICVNDVLVQLSVETLPFGGVGQSGCGVYHGKFTFDTFSHRKAVLVRNFNFLGEFLGKFRYPPYDQSKLTRGQLLLKRRYLPPIPFNCLFKLALVGLGTVLGFGLAHLTD